MVARTKPAIPDGAWPLLLALRSFAGDGPIVGLPSFRRVLALAPHPDDEIGCSGTLALLGDAGADVTVLFATDGEATRGSGFDAAETARRRRSEAERAGLIIGFVSRFLGRRDGGLPEATRDLGVAIGNAIDELAPDVLFLPWFLDGHPDHGALSDALTHAPALPSGLEVWGYETWTALPLNRLVDVTTVMDRKRAALAAHETAHLAFDVSAGLELGRWRSTHGLMGRGYAEAFLAAPADQYVTWTKEIRGQ